ncbi:PAS-domain containing protein [Roseomonas sp. BN140053]|uniref:PAS-domain containing protein n=1 Tax=Roseomonas sp. BN140053 TaxID=3391898 RepID=UPI0039EAF95D
MTAGPEGDGAAAAPRPAALPWGAVILDTEFRLRAISQDWLEQVGLGGEPLLPGTPGPEVILALARRGLYGPGDPAARAAEVAALDRSVPIRRITRTAGGRWLQLLSAPLPDGGYATFGLDLSDIPGIEARAQDWQRALRAEDLLHGLRTGVALFGPGDTLRSFNPAYAALIGAPPERLRPGMRFSDIAALLAEVGEFDNLPGRQLPMRLLDHVGDRPLITNTRQRPNGQVIRITLQPHGNGWIREVDDVTALRRAEAEAQRRAALLDAVLAAMPHGVCVVGPDGRISMVNAAYLGFFPNDPIAAGERAADVVNRRVASGEYTPEYGARMHGIAQAMHREGIIERTRERPDGTVLNIRDALLPDGGRIAVLTDITARHRAEAEARRRTEILQVMLDNMRHGICLIDAEGRLVSANALALQMAGLAPEDGRPGQDVAELLARQIARGEHDIPEGGQDRAMSGLLEKMAFRPGRYTRSRPDGTVLEVNTAAAPNGGFVRTFTDVTEDRRVRAELEQALDAAEAANRAKSRFLAAMTHELRTPLNAVIGFSEALLDTLPPPPPPPRPIPGAPPGLPSGGGGSHDFVRAILDAGRHLLGLIEDVLDAARLESAALALVPGPVELGPLLDSAATMLSDLARKGGVTLLIAPLPELPVLHADERRLRQLLLNLLDNAVKFTPAAGRVEISAARRDDGGLEIRIADSGIGMSAAEIEHAFEAFTQLEAGHARRFGGTGLGLFVSRRLCEAMGLELALDSTPGGGTTARLILPRTLLDPAPP